MKKPVNKVCFLSWETNVVSKNIPNGCHYKKNIVLIINESLLSHVTFCLIYNFLYSLKCIYKHIHEHQHHNLIKLIRLTERPALQIKTYFFTGKTQRGNPHIWQVKYVSGTCSFENAVGTTSKTQHWQII